MMEVSVSQSSPAQFPNHENSDERNADWGERYFQLLDPMGHEISIAKPLPSYLLEKVAI